MTIVFAGMAASLDGYIATHDGDLSWLNNAMSPGEDYGFTQTMQRTGAYVIGAHTYREMLRQGMAGGDDPTPTYVVTHQTDLKTGSRTRLYTGDLGTLITKIKAETDKDICVFGGGNLVTQLLDLDLIDEIGISIIPVLLGDGVPFFHNLQQRKRLRIFESKTYPSGIVLLNYRIDRPA